MANFMKLKRAEPPHIVTYFYIPYLLLIFCCYVVIIWIRERDVKINTSLSLEVGKSGDIPCVRGLFSGRYMNISSMKRLTTSMITLFHKTIFRVKLFSLTRNIVSKVASSKMQLWRCFEFWCLNGLQNNNIPTYVRHCMIKTGQNNLTNSRKNDK